MRPTLAAGWMLPLALIGCARGSSTLTDPMDASAVTVDGVTAVDGSTTAPPDAAGDAGKPGDDPLPGADAGEDAGAAPTCDAITTCGSGPSITSVAGDTGSAVSSADGTCSTWLSVLVSDTKLAGSELKAKLTLTSSGGANYDLFVLKPKGDGGHTTAPTDCGAVPNASQNTDGTDIVSLAWNDGTNAPGHTAGDGLVLSVEVRHVSGPCGRWNLLVAGNQ